MDTEPVVADEYNYEDDTTLLSVTDCNNTLSLVYHDSGYCGLPNI